MADLRLRVNGADYGGWTTARVTRGIESIAGSFELSVSDRWAGQATPWPIGEEDECKLLLGDDVVLTGHVDRRSLAYGPEEHALSVSGRDRTGLLVDCSAALSTWEFLGVPLLTMAKRLAEPFGVEVKLQAGLSLPKPLAKLTVDPGDSAFDALERACRMAGVLPVSDGQGGLLLTRAGSGRAKTSLVEGKNILAASADYDASGRFYRYLVLGQHQGTDELSGKSAAAVAGEAKDMNVTRTSRVLLVRPEGAVTTAYAKQRAAWEAAVRAARGDAVTVTVQGWTQGDGTLWPVNALVHLQSPLLGVDGDMLITQAAHSLDDNGGTTTQLSLKRPDAFLPEPTITKASTTSWKELAG
jgi:prophage tail gpP-like protein